jgi:hypothetical protein
VGVETTRATTAEALALAKAGGTMSGVIAMGASKITGLASGTAATDAAAYGQITSRALGLPGPAGSGYVGWTGDYATAPSLTTPTVAAYPSGAVTLIRMDCPPGAAVTGTLAFVFGAVAGLANTYFAAFNSSGVQLGSTSSDLSATTTQFHTTALGAFTIPADGIVYIAYLNGTSGVAGGPKYFPNMTNLSSGFNLAAPLRCSHLTGALTAMPSSLTLSSFTTAWYTYQWLAIY